MNRTEFMTQLAALLRHVSEEEREDAMQYYNDYFDDAGEMNEQQVMIELGSPHKVAETIKANLGGGDMNAGEFTETGYTDSRFEEKEPPAGRDAYHYDEGASKSEYKNQNNGVLKVLLIIAIVVFGIPVILPIAITVISLLFAAAVTVFALFFALIAVAVALLISGVVIFVIGAMNLVPALAIGIALIGVGLVLTTVGVIACVASVKLCMVTFPAMFRWVVWLCRRPFQGRAVA